MGSCRGVVENIVDKVPSRQVDRTDKMNGILRSVPLVEGER